MSPKIQKQEEQSPYRDEGNNKFGRFRMALLAYNQNGLDEALALCNTAGVGGLVDRGRV